MLQANNTAPATGTAALAETAHGAPWQRVLRDAVRDTRELALLLDLPHGVIAERVDHTSPFALLVPRGFVARMRRGDPDDPLLVQVLPRVEERSDVPGFVADPLDEHAYTAAGVVHKYPRRVLLVTTGACPIHCRYCFRRHFPYSSELAARDEWRPALAALAAAPETIEVILSGGDPLSLSTHRLAALLTGLAEHPGLRYVRLHTRFPITIPERVDDELVALLEGCALRTIVVVHTNHPNELADGLVRHALGRLAHATHAVLNQSVLLRGVNDSAAVLAALSHELFACQVLPYYIHRLDRVAGAAHFEIDLARALEILAELRASLPGFLVPRFVQEEPGELSKTVLA